MKCWQKSLGFVFNHAVWHVWKLQAVWKTWSQNSFWMNCHACQCQVRAPALHMRGKLQFFHHWIAMSKSSEEMPEGIRRLNFSSWFQLEHAGCENSVNVKAKTTFATRTHAFSFDFWGVRNRLAMFYNRRKLIYVNGHVVEPLCMLHACQPAANAWIYSRLECTLAHVGNGSAKRDCRAGFGAGPSRGSVYAHETNHARENFRRPSGCPRKDFQWVRLQKCPASEWECVMLVFYLPKILNRNAMLLQDFESKARASQKNAFVTLSGLWSPWPWPRPTCQFTMTPCSRPFAWQSARASQTERFGWWCTIWKSWCSISAIVEKRESCSNECSSFTTHAAQNHFVSQVC